uniref:Formamidopyrimidine-DNA glycosylase n=2 Tax=Lactococcus lactis subsp. cremoris TaxID=1359 RepID=FPG_LACLC|nr:RecName: Full=Formamidopyrimidine-DNA glycosylase; Short=Fapy-DNA glycosylase; AltName: Full=DNA-(apurinic or apyrimidinic site) lyase MutM; Short=AP lyase MutM [Lactococcus cremoris]CAA52351.1 formamidopyrimidine-DNA-glycosylase [Lactococcus cremoris]
MPELPEVETVRRELEKRIVGQKIISIEATYPRMVLTGFEQLKKELTGKTIQGISRRGKYLIFEIGDDFRLISHLRMEGKYRLATLDAPREKHDHLTMKFADGQLIYADVRKFGTWELISTDQVLPYFLKKKIGPEPTYDEDFDEKLFREKLRKSTKKIKPYLLEQTLVAGLGNIYVDEVLWLAKIHPEKETNQLIESSIHLLHDSIIEILQKAIKLGGSSIRTYSALGSTGKMQNELQVYGKTGEKCSRCGAEIQKIKVAGRGTHFCPVCQQK